MEGQKEESCEKVKKVKKRGEKNTSPSLKERKLQELQKTLPHRVPKKGTWDYELREGGLFGVQDPFYWGGKKWGGGRTKRGEELILGCVKGVPGYEKGGKGV